MDSLCGQVGLNGGRVGLRGRNIQRAGKHRFVRIAEVNWYTGMFYRLTWILGVNKTKNMFYTSDNPIVLRGHEKTDHFHGVGLSTPGIEIAYPLSPDVILVMVDGEYHKHLKPKDRRYSETTRLENIMYYNSLTTLNAQRFIVSLNDDFSIAKEQLERKT